MLSKKNYEEMAFLLGIWLVAQGRRMNSLPYESWDDMGLSVNGLITKYIDEVCRNLTLDNGRFDEHKFKEAIEHFASFTVIQGITLNRKGRSQD